MFGNALRHPNAQESGASARARLSLLLAGCTGKALHAMSVDSLVATHRVKFADAAEALQAERERRGHGI